MTTALTAEQLAAQKPADVRIHESAPFNSEPPAHLLTDLITPLERLFTRNHHAVPQLPAASWTLTIDGLVEQTLSWTYAELQQLPQVTVTAAIECAGNHRAEFRAAGLPADGVPWTGGAVANIQWRGIPLRLLLEQARPHSSAVQVECRSVSDSGFARGVELDKLLSDGLLVLSANDAPLPALHGGPLRIAVPGWYGINYVKWITRLTVLDRESASDMNRKSYVLYHTDGTVAGKVRSQQLKSMFVGLTAGQTLRAGMQTLHGYAWYDGTPISGVDVSVDDGAWQPAELGADLGRFAWRPFRFDWHADVGPHRLRARARAADGTLQPLTAPVNLKGYLMHAVTTVAVTVE
jgi:sulfite oxidase